MFPQNHRLRQIQPRNFPETCGHTLPAHGDLSPRLGYKENNMKQHTSLNTLILAAALTLGTTIASAQSANVAVPTPGPAASSGLLGSRYTEVSYHYVDLSGPAHADGVSLAFNQPLKPGFDLTANYSWAKADFDSFDAKVQDLDLGLKAYSVLSWGRPYAAAAVGWEWVKAAGIREDSFVYKVGVGVELEVSPALTVTPFVNFVRATGFNASEVELGAKASYRLNNQWSVTTRAQYEFVRYDDNSAEYSVGAIFHF